MPLAWDIGLAASSGTVNSEWRMRRQKWPESGLSRSSRGSGRFRPFAFRRMTNSPWGLPQTPAGRHSRRQRRTPYFPRGRTSRRCARKSLLAWERDQGRDGFMAVMGL